MSQDSTGVLILHPRSVASGDPAGQALENINTNIIANGSLCYVIGGAGQGEWQLQKEATDAPDGVTIVEPISGPGRWFIKILPGPNGGGGGGVNMVSGINSVQVAPTTGNVVVDGALLYARDGSNGAMTAAVNFGGNPLTNASNGSFSGAVTGATFNGVALTTGGLATEFLNAQGNYVAVGGGGSPGAPDFSLQFNDGGGGFGGNAGLLFESDANGPRTVFSSPSNTATNTGVVIDGSGGATAAFLTYNEAAAFTTLAGADGIRISATSGSGSFVVNQSLTLSAVTAWTTNAGSWSGDVGNTSLTAGASFAVTTGAFTVNGNPECNYSFLDGAQYIFNARAAGAPTSFLNSSDFTVNGLNGAGATFSALNMQNFTATPDAGSTPGFVSVNGYRNYNFDGDGDATGTFQISNHESLRLATTATGDLVFNGGTDDLTWPAADGTANQVMFTDGSGALGFADVATLGGGQTQTIVDANAAVGVVADPGASNHDIYLLTNAGARTISLPASAGVGAQITVKEAAGTAPIAITVSGGGNIDGAASYNLSTAYSSGTFVWDATTSQWWSL